MRLLPQGGDEQVPQAMSGEVTVAPEAVLDHLAPGATPGIVSAQGSQGHAQIARGQDAELRSEPAAGSPIIGHSYDRGDLVGQAPK